MALAAAQRVDEVAADLVGTGTVTTDRFHPFAESDLPAWRVVPDQEDVQSVGLDGMEEHVLTVACEGHVRAVSSIDDAMNNLAAAGLTAINAAHPNRYLLQGIDRDPAQDSEAAVGKVTLRLATRFFVSPAAPEVIVS